MSFVSLLFVFKNVILILGGYKTLKVKDIIRHVISMINHPNWSRFILTDYSNILLHDILTCHQYIVDISQSQWAGTIMIL